jgi:hypothetical protein
MKLEKFEKHPRIYTGFPRPLENLEYPGEKSSSWRTLKCPGILVI